MRKILVGSPAEYIAGQFGKEIQSAAGCDIAYAGTIDELQHKINVFKPDTVMLDGVAARSATHYKLGQLTKKYKKLDFGIFTYEDISLRQAARYVHFGAKSVLGFRYHDEETIKMAMRRIADGKKAVSNPVSEAYNHYSDELGDKCNLTEREAVIFGLIARHFETHEICRMLVSSEDTVRNHIKHIHKKLGTSDRGELVGIAHDIGEIPKAASSWARLEDIA